MGGYEASMSDEDGQVSEVSKLKPSDTGANEVNADGVPPADKARSEPGGDGHVEYGDDAKDATAMQRMNEDEDKERGRSAD